MKAIRIHKYGGTDVLRYEDAPAPEVRADDVLIRVAACSFNPIDAKIRQGFMKDHLPKPLPFVLGWDGAGTVEKIGGDVTRCKVGDEVFTMAEFARGGTYAEFVAVNENQVARKPRTLSLVEAAALPMTAQTAWTALETAALQAGQRILIHGGAGGVGAMAIQMAKACGAYVITTAAGDDLELVKSLGADEAIDYRTGNFKDTVKDVDVVLDVIGGRTQEDSWPVLKPGGLLIATAQPPALEKAEQHGVRAQFIFTQPRGAVLERIAELVDARQLYPLIGVQLDLKDARQAHEPSQTGGAKGKIVLRVEQP